MNVVKMSDGRWLMADVIPLRLASYIDAPRFLPILRSRYRENHVAYRSDTHYGVGDLSNIKIPCFFKSNEALGLEVGLANGVTCFCVVCTYISHSHTIGCAEIFIIKSR